MQLTEFDCTKFFFRPTSKILRKQLLLQWMSLPATNVWFFKVEFLLMNLN